MRKLVHDFWNSDEINFRDWLVNHNKRARKILVKLGRHSTWRHLEGWIITVIAIFHVTRTHAECCTRFCKKHDKRSIRIIAIKWDRALLKSNNRALENVDKEQLNRKRFEIYQTISCFWAFLLTLSLNNITKLAS